MTSGASRAGAVRWVRSPRSLWRVAPGFLVAATPDGEVTRAEGPAPEIWELLARPCTVEEVAATLADRYAAPVEQVAVDVAAFLTELDGKGLVERVVDGV